MQNLDHFSSLSPANCETHKACNQNNHRKKKNKVRNLKKKLENKTVSSALFRGLKLRDGYLTIGVMRVTLKYISLISIKTLSKRKPNNLLTRC